MLLQSEQNSIKPSITFSTKRKMRMLSIEDQCVQEEFLRSAPDLDMSSKIMHFDWLKIETSTLQKGTFILLVYDVFTPIFGLLADKIYVMVTFLFCILKSM